MLLEGLEISEVKLSELERTSRIDSEFYAKRNIEAIEKLKAKGSKPITNFVSVSDGNHMSIRDDYCEEDGIPYYRGTDIYNFFIEQSENNLRIQRSAFESKNMQRSHLKKGDVLMSIVGAIIGNLALVTTNKDATCSCKLAIMRPFAIESIFLAVYLKSNYGQNQIQKFKRGTAQTGLILEDFDQIIIPAFSSVFVNKIEGLVNISYEIIEKSKHLYCKAQTTLLNSLGIANFFPSTETVNIKSFQDSFLATGRLDAEHYQPKYEQIEEKIKSYSNGYTSLSEITPKPTNGVEIREYCENGTPYLRIGDIKKLQVDEKSVVYVNTAAADAIISKVKLREGDVLMSRSGSLGVTCVVEKHWAHALISSHLIILRIEDKHINSYFLALFLSSFVGKLQIEKHSNGGVQPEINHPSLKSILVPKLDMGIQTQIADLVQQSFTLKADSERLLAAAKRAVEIAIEADEAAALDYLNREVGNVAGV